MNYCKHCYERMEKTVGEKGCGWTIDKASIKMDYTNNVKIMETICLVDYTPGSLRPSPAHLEIRKAQIKLGKDDIKLEEVITVDRQLMESHNAWVKRNEENRDKMELYSKENNPSPSKGI
jgi:hypothetical protein